MTSCVICSEEIKDETFDYRPSLCKKCRKEMKKANAGSHSVVVDLQKIHDARSKPIQTKYDLIFKRNEKD